MLTRLTKPDWRCWKLSSVLTTSSLFSVFIFIFAQSWANLSHQFLARVFLQSCWAWHILQHQLHFPSSHLCDTNLRTRQWEALPFTCGGTLPPWPPPQGAPWAEWWNSDHFKCIPAFRGSKRLWARCFSLLCSTSWHWDTRHNRGFSLFLVTAARRTSKSNEPCYDWANYTGMINMQSRSRCKVLFVQTFVGGQEDVWFILCLTSLDEAEELAVKDGALRWSHSLLYIYLQHHLLFSACVQTFLYLNSERVRLRARQQEMVERIRCIWRLCSVKSVIPISSIWGVLRLQHVASPHSFFCFAAGHLVVFFLAFKVANFLHHEGYKCTRHRLLLNKKLIITLC